MFGSDRATGELQLTSKPRPWRTERARRGRGEAESPERALFERPNGSENIALSGSERAEGFLPVMLQALVESLTESRTRARTLKR